MGGWELGRWYSVEGEKSDDGRGRGAVAKI